MSSPKEISYHCELLWLSAFTLSDHKPPCSFLTLSPTYHPKEPFWQAVKRIKIICSVHGAQTHLSTPYEAKRAWGASAQDRSHGVCVAQTNWTRKEWCPLSLPHTLALSAMHCTGYKRHSACTAACQSWVLSWGQGLACPGVGSEDPSPILNRWEAGKGAPVCLSPTLRGVFVNANLGKQVWLLFCCRYCRKLKSP